MEASGKSGCPWDYPYKGTRDFNMGKCCKGGSSTKCQGAAPTGPVSAISRKYPYWGWGKNEGLRCKYNNNTGCDTKWEGSLMKDAKTTSTDQGSKRNLKTGEYCTGGNQCESGVCSSGKKCVAKPAAPTPAATTDIMRVYPHWGWRGTKNEGLRCKFGNNTGCTTKWVGGKLVEA